ncbi:MAG: BtpA/SgcQ family protein [Anaerolineaceae bacterium]|nr:BtpA/SgcQ family protein [Anaerolineaceae bacterium]
MSRWIFELFGVKKPIIAMCHLHALPGDPQYDSQKGLEWVAEMAKNDLIALQEGGVDAVMFSNESSLPYLTEVEPITTISMARIITELYGDIRIPFGVNVLWDPYASIDLAVATGASFVREIFSGVYASDFGIWNTNCGKVIRHQYAVHAEKVRLFFNIVPEAAAYLGDREISDIARSTVFNTMPDAVCVSGLTAGVETSAQVLRVVKDAIPDVPVFANTGVRPDNAAEQLSFADGAIVGTTFKRDGYIWNEVDTARVKSFMQEVNRIRK